VHSPIAFSPGSIGSPGACEDSAPPRGAGRQPESLRSSGLRLSHEQTQGDFPLPPDPVSTSQRYSASAGAQTSTRRDSRSRYRLRFFLSRSIYYILGGDISTGTAREIEVDTVAFPTLSTHSRTSYTVEESSCRGRPEDSVFLRI
jgi:hypothetical protein